MTILALTIGALVAAIVCLIGAVLILRDALERASAALALAISMHKALFHHPHDLADRAPGEGEGALEIHEGCSAA